ncbi:MAG: DUF4837 family protein [Bacteroidaceae bacterium]|nr:DUF4837 family protein [Bacteroidaceae bacterium]
MSNPKVVNVTVPLPYWKGLGVGLLFLCFLCALCVSCEDDKPRLPESKGQPAELLVVLASGLTGTDVADTLETIVDCDAPGLGGSERIFRTMTIGEKGYEKVYKLMHSQLHVELDPTQKTPVLGVAYDVHARDQLQMLVRAASQDALCKFLCQNRERIQRIILDFQLDRYARFLQHKYSKKVSTDMRQFGYDVLMPSDIQSTKTGRDFLWASSNRGGDKDINFVYYSYPWSGGEVADTALFVRMRDSVMQANIPGGLPGQYMTTSRGELGQPVLWPAFRRIGDQPCYEVRGLWEMHNGYMGGPFVSLVRVDTIARRVVVTEGFVFSPNSAKRDLLRSVEAGLRTLRPIKK